jgi:hypothetical protein
VAHNIVRHRTHLLHRRTTRLRASVQPREPLCRTETEVRREEGGGREDAPRAGEQTRQAGVGRHRFPASNGGQP